MGLVLVIFLLLALALLGLLVPFLELTAWGLLVVMGMGLVTVPLERRSAAAEARRIAALRDRLGYGSEQSSNPPKQ